MFVIRYARSGPVEEEAPATIEGRQITAGKAQTWRTTTEGAAPRLYQENINCITKLYEISNSSEVNPVGLERYYLYEPATSARTG